MAILKLVTTPNPILKEKSLTVEKINQEIQTLLNDMLETMYHNQGVGLAAVQVGELKRIMILDFKDEETSNISGPIFFINPEIISFSKETISYPEGCLSFPGGYADIIRPKNVVVKYLDQNGTPHQQEFTDWWARGIQHEMDHLDGITLIDHVSKLKAQLILKKVAKNLNRA